MSQEDPTLITDIKTDLQEECGKFGTVKKILVFDVSTHTHTHTHTHKHTHTHTHTHLPTHTPTPTPTHQRHPDGVVSLAFKEFEAADLCVTRMNGRWYAGRQLEVSLWDGLMDFQVRTGTVT